MLQKNRSQDTSCFGWTPNGQQWHILWSEKRAIYGTIQFFTTQLALPPFDYVALGHLHRYKKLNPNGYPAIIYSGSIERIDFGERKKKKVFASYLFQKKIKLLMNLFQRHHVHLSNRNHH